MQTATKRRRSKYVESVRQSLAYFGHATNAQLADDLRRIYPHVSDTTVHRITQRLLEDGETQLAPNAADGAMVFDSNIDIHDHFECAKCEKLRDITVSTSCRESLRSTIGDCRLNGSLKIVGTCCECIDK
ncbi:transcriptional repressor [Candidatus Nomurabacteria bacterium]|nr:transcriptional repressor [Candidatus Nomurabacteria bacterium]